MKKKLTRSILHHFKMARQAHALSAEPARHTATSQEIPQETLGAKIVKPQNMKHLAEIPGPSGLASIPFIGPGFLLHPFTHHRPEKIHLLFKDLHEQYGRMVKMRRGRRWNLFLFHPQLIMEAIQQEGIYPDRPSMPIIDVYFKRKGLPKSVGSLKGEEWNRLRKAIQTKTLRPAIVDQYIPTQNEVADDFVSLLPVVSDSDVSVETLLLRYATESSGVYCFNSRQGFLDGQSKYLSEDKNSLLDSMHTYLSMVAESFYTFPTFKYYRTKLYKQFEQAADHIYKNGRKYIDRQVADIEARRANGTLDASSPNLLRSMLEDVNIRRDQCNCLMTSFFVVATENAAKSLAIMLWYLAKYPDKQATLYKEIREKHNTSEVTAKSLSHMPYLKACLRESHRMVFPTPCGTARIVNADMLLDGYLIPKHTTVHYGNNTLCHSPEYFPSPEEYIPERWLDKDSDPLKHRLRSFIVMPFGFGPRNCLGKAFAERQIYLLVVKLLMTYTLTLKDPQESLDIVYKIIAANRTPLHFNFEKRIP